MALEDVTQFLKNQGQVICISLIDIKSSCQYKAAIYDGTNTTIKRRKFVTEFLKENLPNCNVIENVFSFLIFLCSWCGWKVSATMISL